MEFLMYYKNGGIMKQKYFIIGNNKFPIIGWKEILGKKIPVLKAEAKTIKHEDGRVDVIIKTPILKVKGNQ